MLSLGIDIGSVSAKACLIDSSNKILRKEYIKNEGIIKSAKNLLSKFDKYDIDYIGITGSGRDVLGKLLSSETSISEIIAHAKGAVAYNHECRSVIDIGGEDSKLILIDEQGIHDFKMNTACGGGTGAMIEAIGSKFGVKVEDFGKIALNSKKVVRYPSKCGIFCQSAVVSSKNMGVNVEDIFMGVCRGIVENYMNILVSGKELKCPILFQGACAKNKALVKCFEEKLSKKVIVPENCEYMGAIGAAITASEQKIKLKKGINEFLKKEFSSEVNNAQGCPNNCDIIKLKENGKVIASFGNRCEKCSI